MNLSELEILEKVIVSDVKRDERLQIMDIIKTQGLDTFDITIAQEKEMKEYVQTKKAEYNSNTTGDGFTMFISLLFTNVILFFSLIVTSGKIAPKVFTALLVNTMVAGVVRHQGQQDKRILSEITLSAQAKYIQETKQL